MLRLVAHHPRMSAAGQLRKIHYKLPKPVLLLSQCTQRAPYKHESSSAERRNFSDLECSGAVLYSL
jgi:hypothetical protein